MQQGLISLTWRIRIGLSAKDKDFKREQQGEFAGITPFF
jgi:hypothetical protein